MVAGQVQRLLRRTGALDRHGRLSEQGAALLEVLHKLPGIGCQIVAVVRGNAIAPQGITEPVNGSPIELEAGADHQLFIADGATIFEHDQLAQRVEPLHARLDPAHATGNGRGHGARGARCLEHTGTDHGPAGLVVMNVGRIDHRDIQ
ncbi:hypothetical protein D3C81_1403500 [compost metagenome]